MSFRIGRLLQMSGREVSWRVATALRTTVQRMAVQARPAVWDRGHLAKALDRERLDAHTWSAIAARDWPAVHDHLASTIRSRPGRFVLDPASSARVRSAILSRYHGAEQDAARRADRILEGRYDLLGYEDVDCRAGNDLDWTRDPVHERSAPRRFWADVPYLDRSVGDHKVIWELNRHQHWLQLGRALWLTGSPRYGRAIVAQMRSWMHANPPLIGINWSSMLEVGLRAISWTWAAQFLLADEVRLRTPWLVDLLLALSRQMSHLERNLSYYFSPNTHLTGEALALYTVGSSLPELAGSRQWAATGRRILLAEAFNQIEPDGGHAERSTHYQRYTLDFYLLALLIAERTYDADAIPALRGTVTRLAECTRLLADDEGRLPLIGDDDGGMLWPIAGRACHDVRDSLATAALVLDRHDLAPWGLPEETMWLASPLALDEGSPWILWGSRPVATVPSEHLPHTGYVVMRDRQGGHAVFDAGPHGFANGGHAHADALSIVMTLGHRPLLIDPGTSTYTVDPSLRNALRSTPSHNTITVDGRSQAIPDGPFGWRTQAHSRLAEWITNPAFDWAVASHDAYSPVRHRRAVLRTRTHGWLIADEVAGDGAHVASAHWHFHPAWTLSQDTPGRIAASQEDGAAAWLLYDDGSVWFGHGDSEHALGWCSPVYGRLIPSWTVRVTREWDTRLTLLTWLGHARRETPPVLERLIPAGRDGAMAATVRESSFVSTFLIGPAPTDGRERRSWRAGAYWTDAQMVHCAEVGGKLAALDLADGTYVETRNIAVSSDEPIRDLSVSMAGDILDLQAAVVPAELRLQGPAVARAASARLNGRPLAYPLAQLHELHVDRADWAEPDSHRFDALDQSPGLLRRA